MDIVKQFESLRSAYVDYNYMDKMSGAIDIKDVLID
jgi:hypothetical protein